MSLGARLADVRERVARACARAGRDTAEIVLVAVSKGFPASAVAEAAASGQAHFGENRVQEARGKIPVSPPGLSWHLVGTLQKNKAREAVRLFDWIHSLDSLELARLVGERAAEEGKVMEALVEVKISAEPGKHGVDPGAAENLVRGMSSIAGLRLRGLMAIPPLDPDPEAARPYFRRLADMVRGIRERLGMPGFIDLSMGMSHDFEVALEEGATIVRVGTAIFGQRGYP